MQAKNRLQNIQFWRNTAVLIFVLCAVSFALLFFGNGGINAKPGDLLTKNVFIAAAAATMLASGLFIIFPQHSYLCAVFSAAWGLLRIADADSAFGFMLFALGYGFAFFYGFFRRFTNTKKCIIVLFLVASALSPMRYGQTVFASCVIRYMALAFLSYMMTFLFDNSIKEIIQKQKEAKLRLPAALFSKNDADILQKILDGEKYESIANKHGITLVSLKRLVKDLFKKIGVSDRVIFLSRYSRYTVILVNETQDKSW